MLMFADPNSGYSVVLNGEGRIMGGTSAVAPMFSAWKALADTAAGAILPFTAADVYQLRFLAVVS